MPFDPFKFQEVAKRAVAALKDAQQRGDPGAIQQYGSMLKRINATAERNMPSISSQQKPPMEVSAGPKAIGAQQNPAPPPQPQSGPMWQGSAPEAPPEYTAQNMPGAQQQGQSTPGSLIDPLTGFELGTLPGMSSMKATRDEAMLHGKGGISPPQVSTVKQKGPDTGMMNPKAPLENFTPPPGSEKKQPFEKAEDFSFLNELGQIVDAGLTYNPFTGPAYSVGKGVYNLATEKPRDFKSETAERFKRNPPPKEEEVVEKAASEEKPALLAELGSLDGQKQADFKTQQIESLKNKLESDAELKKRVEGLGPEPNGMSLEDIAMLLLFGPQQMLARRQQDVRDHRRAKRDTEEGFRREQSAAQQAASDREFQRIMAILKSGLSEQSKEKDRQQRMAVEDRRDARAGTGEDRKDLRTLMLALKELPGMTEEKLKSLILTAGN